MNFSQSTFITFLFSITILASIASRAQNEELNDLRVEEEIVSADTVFDVGQVHRTKAALQQERKINKNEIPRLREEIRQAYVTQNWAQKQIQSNQEEARRLEKERHTAQSELNKATIKMQKVDRLLQSAQGHLDRKQKSRDAVVEKKNAVVQRMNDRIDASQLLVERVEQAERDLKLAEADYQKTLQREREQKIALAKKHANLKKRIAVANEKTNRVKSMKKLVLGRAG